MVQEFLQTLSVSQSFRFQFKTADKNMEGIGRYQTQTISNGIVLYEQIFEMGTELLIGMDTKKWIFAEHCYLELHRLRNQSFEKIFTFEPIGKNLESDIYRCGKDIYTSQMKIHKSYITLQIQIEGPQKKQFIQYQYFDSHK